MKTSTKDLLVTTGLVLAGIANMVFWYIWLTSWAG